MKRALRRQKVYEATLITILAIAIGFYVLVMTSMHNAKYGTISSHKSAVMSALSSKMEEVGFSPESVEAVSASGKEECIIAFLTIVLISVSVIYYCNKKTPEFLRRKYGLLTIGMIITIVAIMLQLNGSSIHYWPEILQSDKGEEPLWGVIRLVRSDEFAVWTPMSVSQEPAGFPALSDAIGGGGTDATWISVGGIPALNKALIFKPLYWGFILFGSSYGMSILWVGRSFLLFFTAYYCAMVFTDGKKHFSFAVASMILLAPYIQWWFSQSIAEIAIYPGLTFLAWRRYLVCKRIGDKIALSILMAWLLGCLVMVGYPAWIIPMIYLVTACIIHDWVKNKSNLSIQDALIMIAPLIIAVGWLGLIALDSRQTLVAIGNSVYPGESVYTGDRFSPAATPGLQAMMLPFTEPWIINSCELSGFISFAPVGAVLTIYAAIKNKKLRIADALLIAAEIGVMYIYSAGIPPVIAKITLMSLCGRLECFYGIIDIILLSRALSSQEKLPRTSGVALTALITLLSILVNKAVIPNMGRPMLCLITAAYFLVCLTLLVRPFQHDRKRYNRFISCCIVMLMIVAGGFVNPVQKDVYAASRTDLIESLRDVNDKKGDLYLCEGKDRWHFANYILMSGKTVFNSTQEYANTEKWKTLDPNGEYADIYNRFCHISIEIIDGKTEFELMNPDYIHINLNIDDLKKIGIKYVVTQKDYTEYHGVAFEKAGEGDGWKIYRLSY